MRDPIIIDPPGFDVQAAWKECQSYSDRMHECGRPTAAAFGADPGICSCPCCGEHYWAWGNRQRCAAGSCGFEYPTDWWPMYSYGTQAARHGLGGPTWWKQMHEKRMQSPYYRYGFEHPTDDPINERDRIDWRAVMTAKE